MTNERKEASGNRQQATGNEAKNFEGLQRPVRQGAPYFRDPVRQAAPHAGAAAMNVALLTVDLALFDAMTLKDKRRVIHGLKARLRNRFNVSVAEVDYQDAPKRCRLGLAMVSSESRALSSQLDQIVEAIRRDGGVSLLDYRRELL